MLVSKYKLLIYFLPIIVLSSCEGVMSDVLVEPETSKSQVLLFDTYVEKIRANMKQLLHGCDGIKLS